MLLCSELLKESLRQASGEKLICLKQLECAALGEENIFVDGTLNACIQRVKQANEKISSRERLKSTSELMTLAQFGGGSLGTAIGVLYNSSDAAKKLEMLFYRKISDPYYRTTRDIFFPLSRKTSSGKTNRTTGYFEASCRAGYQGTTGKSA